ncbi:histone H1-like repetitive region-containing protein [Lentzea sp. NBC_00516]|uniref:histone H1-like repetitive region-containing protein n=1 Tax=Lentzea sp. NBC_00516 TaxID=2903582 RepID=UPI002E7FFC8A|nr:histone H1-like repetitive region-containing protein [Lentzea sp. NBC_00516]WUD21278.1 histone H1-like repetitive region-containing protein [Lentzea sp. NBC_00516]
MAARGEAQANVEVSTLVVPAWMLRWRAPELALVLGERALALATTRRDEADRLRAESLVVFASNRVGRGVRIADRAIDALKAAEAAGEHETAWLLRVELAACARSVGAPLTGFAAVTPVLEAPDVPAELRASALVQASECLVTVGRGDEPTRALAEADQLYVADTTLDDDTRLLLRGLIRAVQAAQHRRWGDLAAAIGAAREGLDLLSRFSDPCADSGQAAGRLTLELVLSLMDANRLLDASDVGTPMLDLPVRAPSASTTGWLRLALATRVHLPAGRVALAREMLREAAASAERHQLDTLLAESLLALAHVHEVSGELADALKNLRSAHAAERRRARAVYAVRARLAAEFSGVHRQPADLHQQLASVLRPIEGMQVVTDGVLTAALKQQLRQWRQVQVRKGDGLKVKRVRRAAEDMTVEGLSAARQHAADRWRMVQPFGEPDDKTPEPVELPPESLPSSDSPSSDRTVPASGLIASAGAMVSGRRRAARVAAGEIDDDRPTTIAEIPITPALPDPEPQPQLTVEQERKRKVEQQLMELQREARRQIEAERQARAEQRAQAEREAQAAEEAARQEAAREDAARQEAARQEAAREEAARQEAARQEAARQEAVRQEQARQEAARQEAVRQEEARREAARQEAVRRDVARQEAAHQEVARLAVEREETAREAAAREETARAEAAARDEASSSQSESVLDMLKAQGLRAGGRRRARDAESQSETPSWRVEPPSGLRQTDPAAEAAQPRNFFADSGGPARPDYFADQDTQDGPTRSGLSAAFSRAPAAPDFGPHLDEPAYPLHTPAGGFPAAAADPDERKLPDLDFSGLDFSTPKPRPAVSIPTPPAPAEHPDEDPEPEHKPLPSIPDPIPSVPTPAEIPQAPEPDLMSTTFLSSADMDDDTSDVPTTPVQVQSQAEQPRPAFGTQTSFGTQSTFGTQAFGTQPAFAAQPGFDSDTGYSTQPESPEEAAQPDLATQPDGFASASSEAPTETGFRAVSQPDPATTNDPGDRTGRPSSRRRPSDLSLADLLAEALVAYETGRRSDEEQLEAVDLSAPHWSADEPEPEATPDRTTEPEPSTTADALFGTGESFGAQRPSAEGATTDPQAGSDTPFSQGSPFSPQLGRSAEARPSSDALFQQGRPFGSQEPATADQPSSEALFRTGLSFGSQPDQATDAPTGDPQNAAADTSPGSEALFRRGESVGGRHESQAEAQPGSDGLFRPGRFGTQQDPAAEASPSSETPFRPGLSFGSQQDSTADTASGSEVSFRAGRSFGAQQDPAEEAQPGSDGPSRHGRDGSQQDPEVEAGSGSQTPFRSGLSFGTQQDSAADSPSGSDTPFRPGSSFGSHQNSAADTSSGSDTPFRPSQSFGSAQPPAEPESLPGTDLAFTTTPSFGIPQPNQDSYFLSKPPAESEQEKTGPIAPVGAAPDSETTGPIRRVRHDGPAGWTLPGV